MDENQAYDWGFDQHEVQTAPAYKAPKGWVWYTEFGCYVPPEIADDELLMNAFLAAFETARLIARAKEPR